MTLIIGIPSKGRLQDNAAAFFARAGLKVLQARGGRDYRGVLAGVEGVEVVFLSASDITAQLASGAVHLGITGEDLIRETIENADETVELLVPLGFGEANVVVAVPEAWIDVRVMQDLDEIASYERHRTGKRLRVATKYVNLTRRFFNRHGLADYRIVESVGATEGAPMAGLAEIIVDITTTGATLAANGLKILDDGLILSSQAHLTASKKAEWNERARKAASTILMRIAAEEIARTTRDIRASVPPGTDGLQAILQRRNVMLLAGREDEWHLRIAQSDLFDTIASLLELGATDIRVSRLDYVFNPGNDLETRLFKAIAL